MSVIQQKEAEYLRLLRVYEQGHIKLEQIRREMAILRIEIEKSKPDGSYSKKTEV